jgi:hypothetical protein
MTNEIKFTEEWILVGDLSIDREVQRTTMDTRKVERIKAHYNPGALGVITVSRRNKVTVVVLDGQHRVQVVKELTDNEGEVLCHVFEGLTLAEEAQMFLDLNAGNQPSLLDKFRVRVTAGDPAAIAITSIVNAYGWTITSSTQNGTLQCVGALEKIYKLSESLEEQLETNLLQSIIMTVTRAWGHSRDGGNAVILQGLAALISENDINLDLKRLESCLKVYPGGPLGLHTDATQLAALRKAHVSMAIAEQVTEAYNKGRKTKTLRPWGRRK